MKRCTALLSGALAAVLLGSCSSTHEDLWVPDEAPVDADESYLTDEEGFQQHLDLGAGSEPLLTRFQRVLNEKVRLEQREKELLTEIDALRSSLQREQEEKEAERRLRAGAEADMERLRRLKADRDLKVLHLQMQVADLQRTKIQLEIAGLERQIEAIDRRAAQPPAQPPAGTPR